MKRLALLFVCCAILPSEASFASHCQYIFDVSEEILEEWEQMSEEARRLERERISRRNRFPEYREKPAKDINGIHRRRIRRSE